MQVLKPCQICKQAIAKHNCQKCGAHVCDSCFNKEKNICTNCK
ncbi:MAG: hypothetical protein ABIH25_00035 [Candidatus Woesearchaeota archaeon]